jgi:hypothetical protein
VRRIKTLPLHPAAARVRSNAPYPLTEPAASPSTIHRWMNM